MIRFMYSLLLNIMPLPWEPEHFLCKWQCHQCRGDDCLSGFSQC